MALSAALSLGDTVVAVAVAGDEEEAERIKRNWGDWSCNVPIEVADRPAALAGPNRAQATSSPSRATTR